MLTAASSRSLGDRAAGAAGWRLGGALISAVFQFGIGALLARLLLPADFGLVALAFVCTTCGRTNLPETGDWDPPICQECDAAINEDAIREEVESDDGHGDGW